MYQNETDFLCMPKSYFRVYSLNRSFGFEIKCINFITPIYPLVIKM